MEEEHIFFADKIPPSFDPTGTLFKNIKNANGKGISAQTIVLLIVAGLVLIFMVGNYALYTYAQKRLPPQKKKPVSMKKLRKEKLKQGVSAPGE
ncbi:hypothetical protein TIFTF001_000640 [Ficus carica]|uniref:DNA-binding protein S1FA-like n=1 Tax=Ficus carica TaxID=3494 RepID=A0AA88CNH2_FICCA|nr:hypothetical protein TIFTF001_000640 [Ficus carica]